MDQLLSHKAFELVLLGYPILLGSRDGLRWLLHGLFVYARLLWAFAYRAHWSSSRLAENCLRRIFVGFCRCGRHDATSALTECSKIRYLANNASRALMWIWRIFLIAAFITHQSFLYRVPVDFRPVEILPWSFCITKPGRAQRRQGHLSVLAIQVHHLRSYFALFEYYCLHLATDKMTRKSILTCLCALLS